VKNYDIMKHNALRRGKKFSLKYKNILLLKAATHCAYTGKKFTPHGEYISTMERINNTIGYVPGNVIPVTLYANNIKGDMTLIQMIEMKDVLLRKINTIKSDLRQTTGKSFNSLAQNKFRRAAIIRHEKRIETLTLIIEKFANNQLTTEAERYMTNWQKFWKKFKRSFHFA